MTKKDAVVSDEKNDSSNFWAGFARVEKTDAPSVSPDAPTEATVAPSALGQNEHASVYGRVPTQVGGLQPAEWAGVRKNIKKALSTPASKKSAAPTKTWSAAMPQEETDLDWGEGHEARLKNAGNAGPSAPAAAQKQSSLWTRSLARSARPGSRRNAPSLWSLVRALFQKNQNDPPTGQ